MADPTEVQVVWHETSGAHAVLLRKEVMNLNRKAPTCPECGGRLSHKMDCSRRNK